MCEGVHVGFRLLELGTHGARAPGRFLPLLMWIKLGIINYHKLQNRSQSSPFRPKRPVSLIIIIRGTYPVPKVPDRGE